MTSLHPDFPTSSPPTSRSGPSFKRKVSESEAFKALSGKDFYFESVRPSFADSCAPSYQSTASSFTAHQTYTCSIISAIPAKYSLKKARTNQVRVQPKKPQTPALSLLAHNFEMHTLKELALNVDGTNKDRIGSSRLTESAGIFQKDSRAHILPTTRSDPESGFLNSRVGSRSEPPYQSRQNNPELFGQEGSVGAKPLLGEAHTDHGMEAFKQGLQPSPAQNTG